MNEAQVTSLLALANASELRRITYALVDLQNDFRNSSDIRSLFELRLLSLATDSKKEATPIQNKPAPTPIKSEIVVEKKEEPKPIEASKAAIPSFMLEEEPLFGEDEPKEAPKEEPVKKTQPTRKPNLLDPSKISKPNIAIEGDTFTLDDDEIFKIQLLSDKAERAQLTEKWAQLQELKADPNIGSLATLLSQGHPYCLAKEVLILCYDFASLKNKANIKANQNGIQELVSQLLGRTVFVYGIDPQDRVRTIKNYTMNSQLGKLPAKNTIVLNLPKI